MTQEEYQAELDRILSDYKIGKQKLDQEVTIRHFRLASEYFDSALYQPGDKVTHKGNKFVVESKLITYDKIFYKLVRPDGYAPTLFDTVPGEASYPEPQLTPGWH